MKIIGVIPAHFASTRFPGKVLALIDGKPMIEHVWQRAKRARELSEVIIACDDTRVCEAAEAFGARTVMTDPALSSGSDRAAQAIKDLGCDSVVNIQGDEPLIEPTLIDQLVRALVKYPGVSVATLIQEIKYTQQINDPNVVKVVINQKGEALYFSRSPIPYKRDQGKDTALKFFRHLGMYAYRKKFLLEFCTWPKSMLESAEQLEQLRILEAGYPIQTVLTEVDTVAVDVPEDIGKVEYLIKKAADDKSHFTRKN